MRVYETVVILKSDAPEAAHKALIKKIEEPLTKKPGDILKKDDWGVKRLAYEIKHEKKGHYLLWSYFQEPSALGELDRVLRFDEIVLRYMTVTTGEHGKEKKLPKKPEKPKKPETAESADDGERRTFRPMVIDYKDASTLSQFVTDRGKIVPKRQSRLSAKEQRVLAQAIKRARQLALMSYQSGFGGREMSQPEDRGGY